MKTFALGCIRLYQRTISRALPPSCRFVPSCSEYGYEAIERYGLIRGGGLALWRILRCNPWGGHGYDPVPDLTSRQVGKSASRGEASDPLSDSPTPRLPDSLRTQYPVLSTPHTER